MDNPAKVQAFQTITPQFHEKTAKVQALTPPETDRGAREAEKTAHLQAFPPCGDFIA